MPRPLDPQIKAGTTPHWQRPYYVEYKMPKSKTFVAKVDLLDVLVETEMVQSRAEARRLIKQGRIWDMDTMTYNPETRTTKMEPIRVENRYYLAEVDCRLIIGSPVFYERKGRNVLDVMKGVVIKFIK